jgi:hypothetical protein
MAFAWRVKNDPLSFIDLAELRVDFAAVGTLACQALNEFVLRIFKRVRYRDGRTADFRAN